MEINVSCPAAPQLGDRALSALRKMGGGDGKTRKALEAAASATSDQAMGLRRSMSPKEKRDARRGDE